MAAGADYEPLLNKRLAELLAGQGLDARAESREAGKQMDVVADIDGARVVLEAETGFSAAKRREAIKDADRRLKQGLTNIVFAVCYPDRSTTGSLADAELIWTVRTRSDLLAAAGRASWSEPGGIAQLGEAVRQAGRAVGDADGAAQILSEALDSAVQKLPTRTRIALAKALDLPPSKGGDGYFTAAKRGMLVVATAMLFHHRLQEHLPALGPPAYEGEWPPANPSQCAAEQGTTIVEFRRAWRAILAVDYRPVFETAITALDALTITNVTSLAVHSLAGEAAKIAGLVHGLRHDLLGRIFHRVLDTARYDGSFYTSTAAAVLLAALAIREEDCDWSDSNAVERLRICDPACGTGTLLMAAAERIRDLRQRSGPAAREDDELLALALVENVLWGYDINLTATHMAASALGMLSPSTKFGRMNIHRTLLGVYGGVPYLGSLEFLDRQPLIPGWPGRKAVERIDENEGGVEDEKERAENPPKMDLVIMNPPFTRQDLRHDQFQREEELQIKKREKSILDGSLHRAAARLHSSGGMFTVLGEYMTKKSAGILALVLPLVVPTTPGNLGVRQYLAENFHIDTVVSSHDPNRIFMSENTGIGEVLMVLRRWDSSELKPPTRFVNLAENPATALEALAAIEQIEKESGKFTVQHVDAKRMGRGDWYVVNFFNPSLTMAYEALVRGNIPFTVCALGSISDVGGQGRSVPTAYSRSKMPTKSGRRALWQHKSSVITTLAQVPLDHIEPKSGQASLAKSYWDSRSCLLIGERVRLNTSRLFAVQTDSPTIGSAWVTVRPREGGRDTERALCVYINSTVGILARLGGRSNRVPSYPRFAIPDIEATPVPNFPVLGEDVRDALAAAFEELKDETLQPFPQMDSDPIRRRLDDAVTDSLGLDGEWIANIRRSLSEEPSITNKRYAGFGG